MPHIPHISKRRDVTIGHFSRARVGGKRPATLNFRSREVDRRTLVASRESPVWYACDKCREHYAE